MTPWQSHPTFRGLVAAGATDAFALDLAAEWLEEALAELPDVLLWYAGGPPLWHHEDDAQRAGVLWRWLRLVEPKVKRDLSELSTRIEVLILDGNEYRWNLVRNAHEQAEGCGVSSLVTKRDVLQAFPDVEAEITFRGLLQSRRNWHPENGVGPNGDKATLQFAQAGGALRTFVVTRETVCRYVANTAPRPSGEFPSHEFSVRLPAPQWIGEEDVRRAAMMSDAVVRVWRDAEVEAVAGEELFAGDYVDQAPDGRIYRGEVGRQFGRALHNAPAGGAVRIIPPATTRPSGRQRFINLAGDVVEIDEVGQITFITPPASPPAPPA